MRTEILGFLNNPPGSRMTSLRKSHGLTGGREGLSISEIRNSGLPPRRHHGLGTLCAFPRRNT
jgi:hypothetical protein